MCISSGLKEHNMKMDSAHLFPVTSMLCPEAKIACRASGAVSIICLKNIREHDQDSASFPFSLITWLELLPMI